MPSLTNNIVLIGFMGVGKSAIGRRLAREIGYTFLDTDQLVVEHAGMEITEIFQSEGEPGFRERESAVLKQLLAADKQVIATGGGIVARPGNVPLLRQLGFVVWLHADEEVIFERVSRNQKRPLLHTADPRKTIHDLLSAREALYAQTAHCSVDTSSATPEKLVEQTLLQAERFFACQP